MPDSIMYQEDGFVVLETNLPEQFLSPQALLEKLTKILEANPELIPRELKKFNSNREKAQYLRDNYCELDIAPDQYLQWYVVRLEK